MTDHDPRDRGLDGHEERNSLNSRELEACAGGAPAAAFASRSGGEARSGKGHEGEIELLSWSWGETNDG